MITFKALGNLGQLGNQLFQIASTIGIAEFNRQKYVFPSWKYSEYFKHPVPQTDDFGEAKFKIFAESHFHYSPVVLGDADNWDLYGYFQSEKYFTACQSLIRFYFEPKSEITKRLRGKYENVLEQNTCSIHVRRNIVGDFTTRGFLVCPLQYYETAIQKFPESVFLVFSNDMSWCEQHFKGDRFVFVKNQPAIDDLFLMSMSKHNIIGNSTFSWWAAWLNMNPRKTVFAPTPWFGWAQSDLNTDSLIPEGWAKLNIDYAFSPEQLFMRNVIKTGMPLIPRFVRFALRKEMTKNIRSFVRAETK